MQQFESVPVPQALGSLSGLPGSNNSNLWVEFGLENETKVMSMQTNTIIILKGIRYLLFHTQNRLNRKYLINSFQSFQGPQKQDLGN
jgi:hypothetical protein